MALAIGALVAGLALLLRTPWHSWGDDFAGYLLQAHAMAEGKMGAEALLNGSLVAASDSFPAPAAYPWGFPTLLWIGSRIGGSGLMPLKAIGGLSLGIAAAFTFALGRSFLSRSASVLAAALVGLQPELLRSADLLLSDLPFLAVAAGALYCMDRTYRTVVSGGRRGLSLVAAVLAIAAFTIRASGITVAATFVLMYGYLWVITPGRRGPIIRSGALYASVVVVLGALYAAWSPADPSRTYATLVTVSPRSVLHMAEATGLLVSSFVPFRFLSSGSTGLMALGVAATAGLVVLGAWARRPFAVGIALFGLLNAGLLIVFPFVQGSRLLYPLLIPGVILALCGVQSAWASPRNPLGRTVVAKGRVEGAVPWFVGGVVAVLAMEGYGIGLAPRAYQSDGPYSAESEELTRFIVEKVPRDARIAFFRPRALRLLTGRPALAIMSPDPGGRATYFVLNKRVTPDNRGLLAKYQLGAEYFEEHQSEFEVSFENEQFVLYRRLTLPP